MIFRIEAYNTKDKRIYHWDRNTIGNIINNISKLMKLDGFWKDIKIWKQN
jgi:hypothetical protein